MQSWTVAFLASAINSVIAVSGPPLGLLILLQTAALGEESPLNLMGVLQAMLSIYKIQGIILTY